MAGKGGGAWKVAYADFVTAMMAFFLVMWIVGQSKQVKQAVAQYFKDPSGASAKAGKESPASDKIGLPTKKPAESGILPPGHNLPSAISGDDKKGSKPTLTVLHDGNKRMPGAVVLFAEGSADLSEAGKDQLKRVVPTLHGKRNKIEIRGHATRRPLPAGSLFQDPWQLSYARCVATMKWLEREGVEPERLRLSQAGVHEPQTIRAEPDKLANNSRVEVYVLPELVEDLVGTREERAERFKSP